MKSIRVIVRRNLLGLKTKVVRRMLDSRSFGFRPELDDGFAHGELCPFAEVDFVAVEVGDGGAVDLLGYVDDELFGEAHEVVVVGVGLVELEHGELGVVAGADAFVAEVAVDLVDAVEASDDEALEVELGGDAEEEVDVELVVVGGEGAGGGSSGDLLHHGGFDFEVAAAVEEGADGAEDGGSLDEDLADVAGLGLGG